METKNQPNHQSEANLRTIDSTTFMRDVTGGTKHIQSLKTKYLPKYNREEDSDYNDRLDNSELLPSTLEASKSITGKLLLKETVLEDTQDVFNVENIDNAGTTLKGFEHKLTNDAIVDGMSLILVDYPVVEGVVTKTDKQRINANPYFVLVNSPQILNFRTSNVNNETKLTQVTIQLDEVTPDGDFADTVTTKYKVYRNTNNIITVDIWTKTEDGVAKDNPEPILIRGVTDIPLVPFYANKKGTMEATSILREMAELNISWYRLNSALKRTIERCCDPTPVLKGQLPLDENGERKQLSVGSSQLLSIAETSEFSWVGADAAIIQPAKDEIKDIEDRMAKIATELLNGSSDITATEANISNTDTEAKLSTVATNRENALNKAYGFYCQFAGVEPTGKLVVNRDFTSLEMSPQQVENLRKDMLAGVITKETYIKERQKGGELLSIEDIEKEITMAEESLSLDTEPTFKDV